MSQRSRGNGEGSLYQRKDGKWCAAVTQLDGKRKVVYGRTRDEVAAKLTKNLSSIQDGLPLPPERVTVAQFLTSWLEDSARPRLRPNTYAGYAVNVRNHIIPRIGKVRLARLTPLQVQTLLNDLARAELSPRSVQYVHATLRAALQQATRWGQVQRNVAALVRAPKVERVEVAPLSPEQTSELLSAVRGDRLESLYAVALACGLRQGEALGLRWSDVDLTLGTIRVRSQLQRVDGVLRVVEVKTARSRRTVDLPAELVESLKRHRRRQLDAALSVLPAAHVFTTSIGTPLDRHNVTRNFQRILERAKLPRQRFHDLRHLCASLLLAQGVPARVVMEILGHSGIQITMDLYSHVMPTLRRDAAERMNAVFTAAI